MKFLFNSMTRECSINHCQGQQQSMQERHEIKNLRHSISFPAWFSRIGEKKRFKNSSWKHFLNYTTNSIFEIYHRFRLSPLYPTASTSRTDFFAWKNIYRNIPELSREEKSHSSTMEASFILRMSRRELISSIFHFLSFTTARYLNAFANTFFLPNDVFCCAFFQSENVHTSTCVN